MPTYGSIQNLWTNALPNLIITIHPTSRLSSPKVTNQSNAVAFPSGHHNTPSINQSIYPSSIVPQHCCLSPSPSPRPFGFPSPTALTTNRAAHPIIVRALHRETVEPSIAASAHLRLHKRKSIPPSPPLQLLSPPRKFVDGGATRVWGKEGGQVQHPTTCLSGCDEEVRQVNVLGEAVCRMSE